MSNESEPFGAVILSWAVCERLIRHSTDANALYGILMCQHDRGTAFPLANSKAAVLGWSKNRLIAARNCLVKHDVIECVHPGGRGPNDPPIYRWLKGV